MGSIAANLLICVDDKGASREAADRFACAAVRAVAKRGMFSVAVPGGSSPRSMFEILASRDYEDIVPWSRTEFFFTDERCVPPESDESNYKLAFDLLLSTVPIPDLNIHRMLGEKPPDEAAERYEEEMHQVLGSIPRFDLVILGMGTDTHTASLFPNSPALLESGRHVVANYVEKLGSHRLTLTLPVINHAEQVLILAFGSDKAPPLAEALHGAVDTNQHPVQGVRPTSGHLLWVVDRAAASKL